MIEKRGDNYSREHQSGVWHYNAPFDLAKPLCARTYRDDRHRQPAAILLRSLLSAKNLKPRSWRTTPKKRRRRRASSHTAVILRPKKKGRTRTISFVVVVLVVVAGGTHELTKEGGYKYTRAAGDSAARQRQGWAVSRKGRNFAFAARALEESRLIYPPRPSWKNSFPFYSPSRCRAFVLPGTREGDARL